MALGISDFGCFGLEYLGLWVFWPWVFCDFGYFGLGNKQMKQAADKLSNELSQDTFIYSESLLLFLE